ncbi:MAG: TIGR03915 family putative DNA repair protein [Candidatus Azobacteroides sp.]|nr:TIGR03915 family putative DNA repair protein [Candidatus Azobacteroides sp.]
MLYFLYDNTFEGLLTCIFDAFFRKQFPQKIVPENTQLPLFSESFTVITDTEKAERVLAGLQKKLSQSAIQMLFVCFLSEMEEVPTLIFNYIQKALISEKSIELNFADNDVLELSKIYKKVQREAERMRQFVRFQKTADGIFFAVFEPLYNILPLNSEHFEDRFADQQWIVYDLKRGYGLYYDLEKTEIVRFENLQISPQTRQLSPDKLDEYELAFQQLWKDYFKSAAIKERMNLKLHRQHMPKRFWKYLTEKN